MIHGANYFFDSTLNTRELYEAVSRGLNDPEIFGHLGANFTADNEPLLTMPNDKLEVKFGNGVEWDLGTLTYRSTIPGYVSYENNQIEIFSMLYIPEDAASCSIIIPPRKATRFVLNKLFITNHFYSRGIKAPVFEEKVDEAVFAFENNTGGLFLLTEGKAPMHGKNAVVKLAVTVEKIAGREDETGKIDYRERKTVHNVLLGDLIATYEPPQEPIPGKDIFDKSIQPKKFNIPTYTMGKNLVLKQETGEITAGINGMLQITEDKTINISSQQIINGDVDLNTGNLDVNGDLLIEGNILPGFSIKASGDIEVKGNVEESSVDCKGNLLVHGGIVGSDASKIIVEKNCQIGFVRNGNLQVKGDIKISQFVMNSNIISNGCLSAVENKGSILGGTVCTANGIEILVSGNRNALKTELITGINSDRERRLRELADLMNTSKENIKKLKNAMGDQYFKDPAAFLKRLPPNKIPVFKEIILNLKKCLSQEIILEKEYNDIVALTSEVATATIKIYDMANEGTALQIGKTRRELTRPVAATEFFYSHEDAAIGEKAAKRQEPGKKKKA